MLERVTITAYVTPLREGGSLPGLVEADNLGTYVLKFRGAGHGPLALVAEIIAGQATALAQRGHVPGDRDAFKHARQATGPPAGTMGFMAETDAPERLAARMIVLDPDDRVLEAAMSFRSFCG